MHPRRRMMETGSISLPAGRTAPPPTTGTMKPSRRTIPGQTTQIAAYFEAQSWYHGTVPGASFDNNSLSPTERANADFLANYENATWGHSYY